jgi:WKF domain
MIQQHKMTVTTADPIKTTMAAKSTTKAKKKKKKNAAKKKRKVSKHILVANKEREALEKARKTDPFGSVVTTDTDSEPVTATSPAASSSSKKISPSPSSNTKDIKEAAGYLTNWKNYRQQWKFNKNTQSWLIRHMYEADKVAKGTFTLLLEYLHGLGNKQRVLQDATRRALRYKEYSEQQEGANTQLADNKSKSTKVIQFAKDTKPAAADDKGAKKIANDKGATEDEKRWNALCDHDKRKEYKRARKIIETFQATA